MLDIKHYTKLFFNEETGMERYRTIQKEAVNLYENNTVESCWEIAMECYDCDLYYIQMFSVYILGLIAHKYKKAYTFLKNKVCNNSLWQVQEFYAFAFDLYCKNKRYEKSLKKLKNG
jgi:hypothetical protein